MKEVIQKRQTSSSQQWLGCLGQCADIKRVAGSRQNQNFVTAERDRRFPTELRTTSPRLPREHLEKIVEGSYYSEDR